MSELEKIKIKFDKIDPQKWWGDNFDIRFYLIRMVQKIKNSIVVDVGGGIGIILSELDESNFRINVDFSFDDLKRCQKEFYKIENVCSTMNHLPFKTTSIHYVICANLLEVAKTIDLKIDNTFVKDEKVYYKTVIQTLKGINTILQNRGRMYLTTPNNRYYKTTKLEYDELNNSLSMVFYNFSIKFFNTFSKMTQKYRKLNLANIMPKILSKISNREKVLNSLVKENVSDRYSVSFFVEAEKS